MSEPVIETEEEAIRPWIAAFIAQLEAIEFEHETLPDGSYHRCGCDLCNLRKRLAGESAELTRLRSENASLLRVLDETMNGHAQTHNILARVRTTINDMFGFSPYVEDDAMELLRTALDVAAEDPAFAKLMNEQREKAHRRLLEEVVTDAKVRENTELAARNSRKLAVLSKQVGEIERRRARAQNKTVSEMQLDEMAAGSQNNAKALADLQQRTNSQESE